MKRSLPAIAFFLTLLCPSARSMKESEVPIEMTTYYVGLLFRGPKWTPALTPEVEQLQKEHMANIRKMAESGKLILAGPFTDDGKLRGMFVFRVGSLEEAKARGRVRRGRSARPGRCQYHCSRLYISSTKTT